MPKTSAGILPFRRRGDVVEVLIGHPGGPFWARKDDGAWSVIKGEYADEDPLAAARREFREETGHPLPDGPVHPLGVIRQSGGKSVEAWAVEADFDPATGSCSRRNWELASSLPPPCAAPREGAGSRKHWPRCVSRRTGKRLR